MQYCDQPQRAGFVSHTVVPHSLTEDCRRIVSVRLRRIDIDELIEDRSVEV